MARPVKATVDYFPLDCEWGDSLKIVENLYGNNGFIVWVRLLRKLGASEQHYIDCRIQAKWKLLYTEMQLHEDLCLQILNELAELGCINKKLWEQKIIYSEKFIERVKDAYKRREVKLWDFDSLCKFLGVSVSIEGVSVCNNSLNSDNNPQIKEDEIKEKKRKEDERSSSDFLKTSDKAGFVYKLRNNEILGEHLQSTCPLDCDLEQFYNSLCADYKEKRIHKAIDSYIGKKIPQFGVSGAGFQKDFADWLVQEKPEKVEKPEKIRGEQRYIHPEQIKESPLNLDRQKALEFCRNLPKKQRYKEGSFCTQLLVKHNFTQEELEAKCNNTS